MTEQQQEQGVGQISNPPNNPPLRSCPFCGDQSGLRVTRFPTPPRLAGVICDGCGCFFDCRAATEAEAVAGWNRRSEERPNHAYRVGVAVGRAALPGIIEAADELAERVEDWTDNRRPRVGDIERALVAYGKARAALSTLSVHPPKLGLPPEAPEDYVSLGQLRSTAPSTLPSEKWGTPAPQPIENIDETTPEMHTRGIEQVNAQPWPDCPACEGTGLRDSGGVQPWGEAISVPCDCGQERASEAVATLRADIGGWTDHWLSNEQCREMIGKVLAIYGVEPSMPAPRKRTGAPHD